MTETAPPQDDRLSLVIPVRNEGGNIGALLDEVFATLPPALLGEVIVVDDGSTDGTASEVRARMGGRPLRLIRHGHSAGQSRAVRSGVLAARFDRIATMDGDAQNPPADLIRLAAAQGMAAQLVGGHRTTRRDSLGKRLASRAANAIRRAMLRDECPDTGCGLKVFPRGLYLELPFFHGQHRYLPALMRAQGAQAKFLPVRDRARRHGRSNYDNLRRGLQGAVDLIAVAWLIRRARPVTATEERP